MWKTWLESPKGTVNAPHVARVEGAAGRSQAGGGDEEVEQRGGAPRRPGQQEAAGARPGQRALGDRRGQRGGAGRVDGIAPARHGLGACPGGQPVAGGHHAAGGVGGPYAASSGGGSSSGSGRRGNTVVDPVSPVSPASACGSRAAGRGIALVAPVSSCAAAGGPTG